MLGGKSVVAVSVKLGKKRNGFVRSPLTKPLWSEGDFTIMIKKLNVPGGVANKSLDP